MSELMSLYDYLGRAAGAKLGAKVGGVAKAIGARVGIREVSNKVYSGPVNLYERSFLDQFFNTKDHEDLIDEDKRLYIEKMLKKHKNFLPKASTNNELPF
jgi:hypothetical protein